MENAKHRCVACNDPVETFWDTKDSGTVDPFPYCKECWLEKNRGILPNITGPDKNTPRGGTGGGSDEPSPWQENAIRDLEGN